MSRFKIYFTVDPVGFVDGLSGYSSKLHLDAINRQSTTRIIRIKWRGFLPHIIRLNVTSLTV